MLISEALRIRHGDVVAFVGGGGKTTAMFQLARELAAQGKRVLVTTTTRLGPEQAEWPGIPHLQYEGAPDLVETVRTVLAAHPAVLLTGKLEAAKVSGLPPEVVDELAAVAVADHIVVEADGSRTLPFKAPAAHEPVVPSSTTCLVPVVGISVIGAPLDADHVHRPQLVAHLAGVQTGDRVTPRMIAQVLADPEGGLKSRPGRARTMMLVNQVESPEQLDAAREIAHLLLGRSREIEGVAIGAVQDVTHPIRETRRRVAAIVLAAGTGTRMGARVKQLLPWRGKMLIENAIDLALSSQVDETIVVLGARAEIIQPVVAARPVRITLNPEWAQGHSTSIRTGLRAVTSETDAAIFVNADQPLLTHEIVDAVVQRYAETDAEIIAPRYAGRRGSPVLFRRSHFDELGNLHGEEGGREVLAKHTVAFVDFAQADAALDVDTPEDYERLLGTNS